MSPLSPAPSPSVVDKPFDFPPHASPIVSHHALTAPAVEFAVNPFFLQATGSLFSGFSSENRAAAPAAPRRYASNSALTHDRPVSLTSLRLPIIADTDTATDEHVPVTSVQSPYARATTLPESSGSHGPSVPGSDVYSKINAFTVEQVLSLLGTGAELSILLVDLRSNSLFAHAHITAAISACVPSTLLKRNSFTLDKIIGTGLMRDLSHIEKLRKWQEYANIVVYDEHSRNSVENPCVSGLGGKFVAQNAAVLESGSLCNVPRIGFLVGGFDAFKAHPQAHAFLSSEQGAAPGADCMPAHAHSGSGVLPALLLTGQGIPLSKASNMSSYMGGSSHSSTIQLHESPALDVFMTNLKRHTNPVPESAPKELAPVMEELVHPIRLPQTMPESEALARLPEWMRAVYHEPARINRLFDTVESEEQQRLYKLLKFHSKADLDMPSAWGNVHMLRTRSSGSDLRNPSPAPAIGNLKRRRLTVAGQRASDESAVRSALAAVRHPNLNRYHNIWPYDQTRVRLARHNVPVEDEGYINASWAANGAYIVTQAPLQTTLHDFATLVWQEQVRVIVALTAEYDSGLGCFGAVVTDGMGRKLCERYWPRVGEQLPLGSEFTITLVDEHEECDGQLTVRRLQLTKQGCTCDACANTMQVDDAHVRTLVQLHYHAWPDHSVPDTPQTLLHMQSLCRSIVGYDSSSPILVHCSAGCGRTGAFCAFDMAVHAMQQAKDRRDPVAKALRHLRLDRMEMVQTQRQLAFCYEACAWWSLLSSSD